MRPCPATHAKRGAACVVSHPHGLSARWLGRGALAALCTAIPPRTTAAPAGGAHAGGGCAGAALAPFEWEIDPKTSRMRVGTTPICRVVWGGPAFLAACSSKHPRI